MSNLEKAMLAISILSGEKEVLSFPEFDALGYDSYIIRKVPSIIQIKERCKELICQMATKCDEVKMS